MNLFCIIAALVIVGDPPDPRSIPADQRIDYVNKLTDRLDGPNAARSYRTADKKYVAIYELNEDALRAPDSPYWEVAGNLRDLMLAPEWTPAERKVLDEWLKKNKRTLGALRGTTKKARFFEPLKHPGGRLSPAANDLDVVSFLNLGRLMATRANRAAMDGEWEDAYSWIVRMHHMANHLYQSAFWLPRLTAAAIERMACSATIAMVHRHPPSDWEKLIAEIHRGDDTRCPDSVLDEVGALWMLDHLECWREWVDEPEKHADLTELVEMLFPTDDEPDILDEILAGIPELLSVGKYKSAEALRSAIRASSLETDWANSRKVTAVYRAWDALPDHIAWKQVESFETRYCEANQRVPALALTACSPVWSSGGRYAFNLAALHREAMFCQIAIHRFREKEGRWPRKLPELVPDFLDAPPIDSFSGQPLVYKVTQPEGSFTLYSVGPNLVDDGGTEGEGFPRPDGDLVYWPMVKRTVDDE